MASGVPASWMQDGVVAHLIEETIRSVSKDADGNTVVAVPGRIRDDGRLQIVWSWKPAGTTRITDSRRGETLYTPEEAVVSYAASLKRTKKR
ncbi:MAG: hypothetical protein EBS89_09910 [Proteobacteria bacterium]|jgi:hypothetical protein|nr:hypothetical protein [Pseudomonadota bacterium]